MRIDPKRQRSRLARDARRLADLFTIDGPPVLVANRLAVLVREASRIYHEDLVRELAIVLKEMRKPNK